MYYKDLYNKIENIVNNAKTNKDIIKGLKDNNVNYIDNTKDFTDTKQMTVKHGLNIDIPLDSKRISHIRIYNDRYNNYSYKIQVMSYCELKASDVPTFF